MNINAYTKKDVLERQRVAFPPQMYEIVAFNAMLTVSFDGYSAIISEDSIDNLLENVAEKNGRCYIGTINEFKRAGWTVTYDAVTRIFKFWA